MTEQKTPALVSLLERLVFAHRPLVILLLAAATLGLGYGASGLRIDAGFAKHLPLQHEYMKTFSEYRQEFGGANRVLVALMARSGDMFTPEFFSRLRLATDEVFFLPGVDRTRVQSLFTPNVRFTEVVEDGIAGGNVVPADFKPTPEGLDQVRKNIFKAGIVGRLVANDLSGAIISAELLEIDPQTNRKIDYIEVSQQLEEKLRGRFSDGQISVHIIGFAKVMGDVADGAKRVVLFFGLAFFVTGLCVYLYTRSHRATLIALFCPLVAVTWQLGGLTLLGYGVDPMGILVPFLIFAIGVSHAVQMVTAYRAELFAGLHRQEAARASFRRLLVPGGIALLSDLVGFITILFIDIRVIQEMAVTASLGVAAIIFINMLLCPILLSYLGHRRGFYDRLQHRVETMGRFWRWVARVAQPRPAAVLLLLAAGLLVFGLWRGSDIKIGDLHRGVPELRPDSRYNLDTEVIAENFAIGVDLLTVIVETVPNGCIEYDVMETIDAFAWQLANTAGVQSVIALPGITKVINSGWSEGSLKWRVLPRDRQMLVEDVQYIPTSSGLLNADCSVMPVLMFTTDHKAETIDRVVAAVKDFRGAHGSERVRFRLAAGNVGVMAATNEEVSASQFPILLYVFSAIVVLCLLTFRSLTATLAIVFPLALVSLLAYALMTALEIGLKVSTLPVVALGVGVGVDYGIYIYSRLQSFLDQELSLYEAYQQTLKVTGSGVVLTGVTLALGVSTWIFSPLQFQADMGLLLTFMFLVNMLGAILLLPALACWLRRCRRKGNSAPPQA